MLRLLGFGRRVVAAFLGVQAAVLVATAAFLGGAGAVFIAPYLARTSLAVATMPVVDGTVLWRAAAVGAAVLAAAVATSVLAVQRRSVGDLIHRDD